MHFPEGFIRACCFTSRHLPYGRDEKDPLGDHRGTMELEMRAG